MPANADGATPAASETGASIFNSIRRVGLKLEPQKRPLDAIVKEAKLERVDVIKIDVEGAEAGILRGAQRVLHEHHPIILCEVLTDAAGNEVMASLPKDYHFYHIDENGGTKEKACITRRRWRDTNWLLVPKHRIAECCF